MKKIKQETKGVVTVFCQNCGEELRRIDDPEGDPDRTCYRWLTPAGATADNCPGCGVATSLLTTAPALDESGLFTKWRADMRRLPASDRAVIQRLMNRFLQDVRSGE